MSTNPTKPVVAMALSRKVYEQMFLPEDLRRLEAAARVLPPPERSTAEAVAPLLADAAVAVTGWGSPRFDAALLAQAPRLGLVAYSAGSVKPVVSDAMFDRGVRVTTAAAANAGPVAEFTVAAMVMMLKGVPWLSARMAKGEKVGHGDWPIRELRDMSVGLIGASRVGREVVRLLRSYPRLTVRLFDPYLSEEAARELGVVKSSLEDVCGCDVVSCHAPNVPETRHMLNQRTLSLMPDHGVFINTSRGALVDEAALVAEVRRRPLYALLDVTDPEPPPPDSPLRREPHILLTPHIAGAIAQGRHDMGRVAIDETLRFLKGEPLQHEVTREMLSTQA